MIAITESNQENLSVYSRGVRVVLAAVMMLITMTSPAAPLGILALLPLFAIYPAYTAIIGWDPVKALYSHETYLVAANRLGTVIKVALLTLGGILIASVAWVPGTLGSFALLPLLGIVPVYIAIIGRDPIAALIHGIGEQPGHGDSTSVPEQEEAGRAYQDLTQLDIAA